ncbi:MAG: hypothetical protein Q9184_005243, partial [Pyrenodesmia sp. 2 TL-2023]
MPPKVQPRVQAQRGAGQTGNTEGTPRRSSRRSLRAHNNEEETADDGAAGPDAAIQEAVDAISADRSASAPRPAAGSPPHEPTQRLASLRGPGRSVETRLPSLLDSPLKKLKVQPKAAVRRSKEEREAAERAEAERLQARLAESGTSSAVAPGRGDFGGRGGGRGALGGTSNRWQTERYSGAGAGGFLGGVTPAEDKRQREALATRSRGGGRSLLLSDRSRGVIEAEASAKVKKEPGSKRGKGNDKDEDGDVDMGDGTSAKKKPPRVKIESKGSAPYDSDEELLELETGGKRIPIEQISLVTPEQSSDEDVSATDQGKGKERLKTPKPPGGSSMRPVFIKRHEHQQRTIGVNTEPATATSAELRKRAKATGAPISDLPLPMDIEFRDNAAKAITKQKTKPRDVEFIKNERKWQGVYQDEDEEEPAVKVKKEPAEAEDTTLIYDEPPQGTAISQDMLTQAGPSGSNDRATPSLASKPPSKDPKPLRKPKPRRNKTLTKQKPVLQTTEDTQEWHRFKRDMTLIRQELMPKPDSQSTGPEIDGDGDAEIEDVKTSTRGKDNKEGMVYTFQLPPSMPSLEDPRDVKARRRSQRKEKSQGGEQQQQQQSQQQEGTSSNAAETTTTSTISSKPTTQTSAPTSSKSTDPNIKPDPDPTTSLHPPAQPTYALPPHPHPSPLPHGTVGSLTLDPSGFPSATWSQDFRLNVGRASDYAALQEVVLLKTQSSMMDVGRERGRRPGAVTPPQEPAQSPALSVQISTSFPSLEIFGIKLINNHPTLAVLSIENNEGFPISVVFVGGSLWTLPNTPSSPPVPQIVRNLTTTRYNAVEIPAGEKESVEYRFTTELHPQELVLNLAAVVRGEGGEVVTIPAFNETVAVVEAEMGFFDPQ